MIKFLMPIIFAVMLGFMAYKVYKDFGPTLASINSGMTGGAEDRAGKPINQR